MTKITELFKLMMKDKNHKNHRKEFNRGVELIAEFLSDNYGENENRGELKEYATYAACGSLDAIIDRLLYSWDGDHEKVMDVFVTLLSCKKMTKKKEQEND